MYLLDTNVVSELRKGNKANRSVRVWARSVPTGSLFLSAISILEMEIGILRIERRDPKQGSTLRSWMQESVLPAFDGRILGIDLAVVLRCAALHVPNPCPDRDALIAATALVHGMMVVTRNVDDFETTGVKLLDPWG